MTKFDVVEYQVAVLLSPLDATGLNETALSGWRLVGVTRSVRLFYYYFERGLHA